MFVFQDPPDIPTEAPEPADEEILAEKRFSMHPNSLTVGSGDYAPIFPMNGLILSHPSAMSMSMQSNALNFPGKQIEPHMSIPSVCEATSVRDTRTQTSGVLTGSTKCTSRFPLDAKARPPAMPQPSTTTNIQPMAEGQAPPPAYSQPNHTPWMQPPNTFAPPQQQQQMTSAYQNTSQMKQQQPPLQHVTSGVRLTGVPVRQSMPYPDLSMQQQPPSSQMSTGYMNDPSGIMMSSAGANSINANRQTMVPTIASSKRKLNEADVYGNDSPQYKTPAKIALQAVGKISIEGQKKKRSV